VAILTIALSASGCGTNQYQAACERLLRTVDLQHGVTRAKFIADCEREMARQNHAHSADSMIRAVANPREAPSRVSEGRGAG
jgi:hypothetical protein